MSADSLSDSTSPAVNYSSVPAHSVPWTVIRCEKVVSSTLISQGHYSRDSWLRECLFASVDAMAKSMLESVAKASSGIANRWFVVSWAPAKYRPAQGSFNDKVAFELVFSVLNPATSLPCECRFGGVQKKGEMFSLCTSWSFGDFIQNGFWNPDCSLRTALALDPTLTEGGKYQSGVEWSSRSGYGIKPSYALVQLVRHAHSAKVLIGENKTTTMTILNERYCAGLARVLLQSFPGFNEVVSDATPLVVFAMVDLSWMASQSAPSPLLEVNHGVFCLFPRVIPVGLTSILAPPSADNFKLDVRVPVKGEGSLLLPQICGERMPEFNQVNGPMVRVLADGYLTDSKFGVPSKVKTIPITRKSILDTLGAADD